MKKYSILLPALLVVVCACKNEQPANLRTGPKVVEAKGYVVPADSMAAPKVVLVDESKLKKIPERTPFDQLTVADGLPENSVQVILQDHLGFIWFGTNNGLVRYDGNKMTVFQYSAKDPNSLKGRDIFALMEDRNGDIWIGAESLFRFERATQHFIEYPNKNFQLVPNTLVKFIHEDKAGDIWAIANDAQTFESFAPQTLERYDPKAKIWTSFKDDPAGPAGFANHGVFLYFDNFNFLEDKNGKIWLITWGDDENALHWFDRKTDRFVRYKFKAASPEMAGDLKRISGIAFDNAGNLYLSSLWPTGLFHLNLQTGEVRQWKHGPKNPNSLLSNATGNVYQDRFGFVWVPTDKGIDRFDPKTNVFTHYISKPGDLNTPDDSWSYNPVEDPEGNIWFKSDKGVNVYDRKTDRFIRYENDVRPENGLPFSNGVSTVFVDRKGLPWIGTKGAGVFKENRASRFHRIKKDPNNSNSLQDGHVSAIYEAPSEPGVIWFGTRTGLDRFDKKTGKFAHYRHDERDEKSLGSGRVLSIAEDEKGRFWVATEEGGLNLMDRKTGAFTHFKRDLKNPNSLPSDFLTALKPDSDGKLWVGTSNGLARFDNDSQRFDHFSKADSTYTPALFGLLHQLHSPGRTVAAISRPGDKVDTTLDFSLAQTTELLITGLGEMATERFDYGWVEDATGKIIWEMTPANCLRDGSYARILTGIVRLDAGAYRLRYKSDVGYFYGLWDRTPPAHPELWGIQISRVNATEAERYNIEAAKRYFNGLSDLAIQSITEDSKKNIWIGTARGGVTKYDPSTEKFVSFFDAEKGPLCVSGSIVEAGKTGSVWVGDYFLGLFLLNEKGEILQQYDVSNGMPSNAVLGIQPDEKGILWISTDNGLCRFDPATGQFQRYYESHGLQGLRFNQMAFFRTAGGEIYFGGQNGVNTFYPEQIKLDTLAPPVVLTGLDISGKPASLGHGGQMPVHISIAQKITLPFDQNDLTFHFTALEFERGNDCRFAYKLSPKDKDWVQAGTLRQIRYSDLSPGTYVFSVKAANPDGVWNEKGASVTIVILPPPWRTWWAYLIYLSLAGVAVRAFYYYKKRQWQMKMQLDMEHLEAERLKELDSVKTRLYTNITHEFRTPLTVILGMAKQVHDDPKTHFRQGMNAIVRNGQLLLNLVNQMLDLSKLESGKLPFHYIQGDVIKFIRYLVESFHSIVESKGVQLHFLTDVEEFQMDFDEERLQQILSNLLSNAVKFTSTGGNIYLEVRMEESPSSNQTSWLVLKVKDTGIGIAEEHLPFIFDRFYQADDSNIRQGEGTGIGLALTKELVKLMDGEISVKSTFGKGSEFTVKLPIRQTAVLQDIERREFEWQIPVVTESSVNSPDAPSSIGKPLVLIAEDNADVVAYLSGCLEADYRLAVAKDGREAIEIALELVPDLMVTDVMMPHRDGFEVCNLLRNDERTSHIPIIMLTAKADLSSKIAGLEKGADAYLSKPFEPKELLAHVRSLLSLRQKLQQYYRSTAGLANDENDATPPPVLNEQENYFLKKVRKMVEAHLDDSTFTVEQMCREVGVSHGQLHRKLTALTGLSATFFIRDVRLARAKELITSSGYSIAAIANECGFEDPAYFSRVFKQAFKMTPNEWRERNAV